LLVQGMFERNPEAICSINCTEHGKDDI